MNGSIHIKSKQQWRAWLLVVAVLVLGGCGGGASNKMAIDPSLALADSASVEATPYTGPTPADESVQRFKIYFFDQFRVKNRCGACHNTGGQNPQFVREDDVNAAYAQALTVVDLANPGLSRVVEKVGEGHNCWIDSGNAVCAGDLRRAIEQWAGAGSSSTTTVVLKLSDEKSNQDITITKQFPVSGGTNYDSVVTRFGQTVYPLFATYSCSNCHRASSSTPQQPYFASDDLNEAYDAARSKMDIEDGVQNRSLAEAQSRFVVRLRSEFHNCGNDCSAEAQEMLNRIKLLVDDVPSPNAVTTQWNSKAMVLESDGIPASGGGRVDSGAIAKWDFSEGDGILAGDSSGVEPRMNLTLFGDVNWVGGNGIQLGSGGRAQATTAGSKKLADKIKPTGEFTLEAWVAPANVTQEGPARILTYSSSSSERNFTMGQTLYSYDFMNRASTTDGNGEAALTTDDDDEDLQATLQHVVMTYSPVAGRKIYVNGKFTGDADPVAGGNLTGWDDGFAFIIGSEASGAHQFQGVVRFVAIYNRVLSLDEILTNFDAGVGEKYYLMFNVTHLLDIDDGFNSYIVFETSVFDSYSYLFSKPFLYRTATTGTTQTSYSGIPIKGMRVGINGKEPSVGQAYAKLDTTFESSLYGEMGQQLSSIGTVLPLESGSNADEFFLTFETIGDNSDVRVDAIVSPVAPTPSLEGEPDLGLRVFGEVNATMAKITGVRVTNSSVRNTYNTVRQQLPGTANVETFVSAQQMAIAQLAIEYCSEMVDDPTPRSSFFEGFNNFNLPVNQALDADPERALIVDALYDKVVGTNLASQPDATAMKNELTNLMDKLYNRHFDGSDTDTRNIIKATCAAALGSAAMLLQ